MPLFHAVVRIDHHTAQLLQFDPTQVLSQTLKAHSHPTKQHGSSVRAEHEFFGQVCDALAGITEVLVQAIAGRTHEFTLCNYANGDMVGHTGSLPAAIKAAQTVDRALADVRAAVDAVGGILLVTADHGNVEMMRDPGTGEAHTAHTVGPVYFVLCGHSGPLRSGGSLRDIAPTLLDLMALPQPAEMTGRSLIGNTA